MEEEGFLLPLLLVKKGKKLERFRQLMSEKNPLFILSSTEERRRN